MLGTADYLVPELAIDSHRADSRADLYALGCTFYYLLTGRPSFVDGTLPERILAHQTRSPQDVRRIRSDIPPPLFDVLQKMLVKQRAKRIQSAAAVAVIIESRLDSVDADVSSDQPAAMILPESEHRGRRPHRIQTADRIAAKEAPTDSIRAAETQTAASVASFAGSVEQKLSTGNKYAEEFAQFIKGLDDTDGVYGVMNADFLKLLRMQFSADWAMGETHIATSEGDHARLQLTSRPVTAVTKSVRRLQKCILGVAVCVASISCTVSF